MTRGALGFIALVASTAIANASAVGDHIGFDPIRNPEKAGRMYLAPESILFQRLRQPDGSTREFEFDYSRPGTLRSRFGWSGRVLKSGEVRIDGPAQDKHGKLSYLFRNGRLASLSVDAMKTNFSVRAAAPVLPENHSPMLASGAPPKDSADAQRMFDTKWTKSGRLQFPWNNPNSNALLYAELLVAALGILCAVTSRKLRVASACAVAVFAVLLLMAGSRGALLGIASAVAAFAVAERARVKDLLSGRRTRIALVVGCVVFVALTAVLSPRLLTRGFGAGNRGWSNKLRVEVWHNAPRMMVDAPGGWGTNAQAVGLSYMDWYQPLEVVCLTGSLINDHLTWMVRHGWAVRIATVFGWLSVLGLGIVMVFRRRSAFPLAIWSLFAIAIWFNPVSGRWVLWVLPGAALVPLVLCRPWRTGRFAFALALVIAAAATAAVSGGLYVFGSSIPVRDAVHLRHESGRTFVNGDRPRVWAVDDLGEPMGGLMACKGIRAHYLNNPHSAALGYVRSIEDLPASVDRLVLGGRSGDEWLKAVCSDAKRREHLPLEVIFLSPPFPPSAVPPILKTACTVYYVTGEFVTWYHPKEFENHGDWVKVIPGAELYIPGWVEMVTAGVQ